MWEYNYSDELYHYGVKGMRWGVRRYQNSDGSLTNAGKKRLAKTIRKEYRKNDANHREQLKRIKGELDKAITDDDVKRIKNSADNWRAKSREGIAAQEELYELSKKLSKGEYNKALRKLPGDDVTPDDKETLRDYIADEVGYAKAKKARPDLYEKAKDVEDAFGAHMFECRGVADKLLGKYGDMKVASLGYSSNLTVKNVVLEAISSLEANEWWT